MVSPLAINPNTLAAGGNSSVGGSLFPASPTAGGNPFAALGSGPVGGGQQNGFSGFASPASAGTGNPAGNPQGSLSGSIGELSSMLNTMMAGLMEMINALLAAIMSGSVSGQAPAGSGGSGGSGVPAPVGSGGPGGSGGSGGSGGGPTIGSGDVNTTDEMRQLAQAGKDAAMSMGGYNSQGLCATGVSKALRNAMGLSVSGNGNQIDNNLPKDKFRQVDMSLEEALKTPGLILTWESTSTAAGSKYGHTAITLGDGHSSASDFIERNTTNNGRTGFKVFMPV